MPDRVSPRPLLASRFLRQFSGTVPEKIEANARDRESHTDAIYNQPLEVRIREYGWRSEVFDEFTLVDSSGTKIGEIVERGVPLLRGFAAAINIAMPRTFHVRDPAGHEVLVIKRPGGPFGTGPRVRLPDGTALGRWKRIRSSETRKREPTLLVDGQPAARVIVGNGSSTIVDPHGIEFASIRHVSRKKGDAWISLWEYYDQLEVHRPMTDPIAGLLLAVIVRRYIRPRSLLGELLSSI